MYTILALTFIIFSGIVGLGVGTIVGALMERRSWMLLKKGAVAGQRIWMTGIGEVFIMGYSEKEDFVDVLPEEFLNGKWPSQIDQEIVDSNIISIPTKQFLTQATFEGFKMSAKI